MIMSGETPYFRQRQFMIAQEPVHVGSGATQIGLVDNPIIREPQTNLPKIPGSSMAGIARSYAAMSLEAMNSEFFKGKYAQCAGKNSDTRETFQHCGKNDCPICTTFGYTKGEAKSSFQGLAAFGDAHLLLFPVHSMLGPLWVTCPQALSRLDITDAAFSSVDNGHVLLCSNLSLPESKGINLGWRWFEKSDKTTE
ncbi:hypothetical protein GF406_22090 [candidate division KSB1 bacterium]|nr:hypothetical protein [candidate division KSB1 bacterium]